MKKGTLPILLLAILSLTAGCNDDNGPAGDDTPLHDVSVTVSPAGAGTIAPSADSTYEENQTVNLQAQPNDEYLFTGWSGSVESTENPLSVTVEKPYGLTAHFEPKSYEMAVTTEAKGPSLSRLYNQKPAIMITAQR